MLVGPETEIKQDLKLIDAIKRVSVLAQTTITQTYTQHQVANEKSETSLNYRPRIMPHYETKIQT